MTAAGRCIVIAALLVAGGCAGGGGDTRETHIRLVVADKNIRGEGVECAGARPFQHIHADAGYRIVGGDGAIVAEGTLPAGHAVNAEPEIEWEVERIPTFCVVDFEVELPPLSRYRLRLDRGRPVEFAAPRASDEPIVLVVG